MASVAEREVLGSDGRRWYVGKGSEFITSEDGEVAIHCPELEPYVYGWCDGFSGKPAPGKLASANTLWSRGNRAGERAREMLGGIDVVLDLMAQARLRDRGNARSGRREPQPAGTAAHEGGAPEGTAAYQASEAWEWFEVERIPWSGEFAFVPIVDRDAARGVRGSGEPRTPRRRGRPRGVPGGAAQAARIRTLRADGLTWAEIERHTKIPKATAKRRLREHPSATDD